MLSVPDMAILGAAALLLFGPEQLPRVMRKAGNVMRDIQNTSQSFIREMERAADVYEPPDAPKTDVSPHHDAASWESTYEPPAPEPSPLVEKKPDGEKPAEPQPGRECVTG
jgi:sec-independent protein translocase protein TatA